MLGQSRRHLGVEGNVTQLAALWWGEHECAADLLDLLPDVEPAEIPDVVDGEPEDLALTQTAPATNICHGPVPLRQSGPHREHLRSRPRVHA